MQKKKIPHSAFDYLMSEMGENAAVEDEQSGKDSGEHTTSLSLARVLSVGCLARLDSSISHLNIWDPTAGSGFAGSILVDALQSVGVHTSYRGQEINEHVATVNRKRFQNDADAETAVVDTLVSDAFPEFSADLVILDPPLAMRWDAVSSEVEDRRKKGAFSFGLPRRNDSVWLFISLALEKLRPSAEGGGRVAALVNPGSLSLGGPTGDVRRKIVEAGLLESVTRLPAGLAPSTALPLYLVTFTNRLKNNHQAEVMVTDLQTDFTIDRRHRSMTLSAFQELESGMRLNKEGRSNRRIPINKFTRRDSRLERFSNRGKQISWPVTTYLDKPIDGDFLKSRYGPDSGVQVVDKVEKTVDLDPGHIFHKDSENLAKDIEVKGWKVRRISTLIGDKPAPVRTPESAAPDGQLFIPTSQQGQVVAEPAATHSSDKPVSIELDENALAPSFLIAWLNSEWGLSSRRRAINSINTGLFHQLNLLNSDSLMRWADELIVPVPDQGTQLMLASADERLASFTANLRMQRESVWDSPENAEAIVSRLAGAFDESLSTWLDQLPYPIAAALWTAEAESRPGDQQRAYFHACEAIVVFHATVLLSVNRTDPVHSEEVESSIGETLQKYGPIENASFATWVIIIERLSSEFRDLINRGQEDEIARLRRSFADLDLDGIERLISVDLVSIFRKINLERNENLGHSGYISDDEYKQHVTSIISHLNDIRHVLGNVWSHILLVRAGSSELRKDGRVQTAEVAVGAKSPFKMRDFQIGDEMVNGDLYLVKNDSMSPLSLLRFVQLRTTPNETNYKSYFYSRIKDGEVCMVSYERGPDIGKKEDAACFIPIFGSLATG